LIYYSHELNLKEYINIDIEDSLLTEHEVLSITADVFESFLGAIFLDQGIEFAKKFLTEHIFKYIDEERVFFRDYKSAVKEYGDAEEAEITYNLIDERGYPHEKTFIISVSINGKEMGVGKGRSKKDAEQAAAKIALEKLKISVF
jgi:ribonuclease-3